MPDHPIIKKLHESTDGFFFGLWNECPEDAKVAWGARAIADSGAVSMLPDRQTGYGDAELRKAFSERLNAGPLKKALEKCQRLRDGWDPYKLSEDEFVEYWNERKASEPEVFAQFSITPSWGPTLEDVLAGQPYKSPAEAEPRVIHQIVQEEFRKRLQYDNAMEKWEKACEAMPDPPEPKLCENDEEDESGADLCLQHKARTSADFFKEEGEAWVCGECGHWHYFEDLIDYPPEPKEPDYIVTMGYAKILREHPKMFNDKAETFTVYEDAEISIKANTRASHGYVYLIAYPKEAA